MACSPAQLESNRKNAQKSTGPRTAEGKARSRQNSLKHGLTGQGIVLPSEDVEKIDNLFDTLKIEMAPNGELARRLVQRTAFLFVRLDRSAEHESKSTAFRMRHAIEQFDDARLADVEKMLGWIAHEPATHARRLRNSPEGIDLLIKRLEGLRQDLSGQDYVYWDWQHGEHFHHLVGKRPLELPVSRALVLSNAVLGDFKQLGPNDGPDLNPTERRCWAVGEMLQLIEAEIESLKTLRASLPLETLELDRSEAPARAMFDTSKEGILARKYEAATERALFRTLKEFRQVQAEIPAPEPEPGEPEVPEELGSILPEVPEEADEETIVDEIDPERPIEIEPATIPVPQAARKADWIDDR